MLSVPCITLSKQLVNSERRTADLSFLRNSKFGYADRSKTPKDTSSSSSLVLTSCLILPATSSRVLLFFSARTLNGIIYSQIEYRIRFFLSIEAADPHYDRDRTRNLAEGLGGLGVEELEA